MLYEVITASVIFGLGLGVLTAIKQRTLTDYVITTLVFVAAPTYSSKVVAAMGKALPWENSFLSLRNNFV